MWRQSQAPKPNVTPPPSDAASPNILGRERHCSALGVWEQDFINGVVSDGDWAPNDQIGRLDG